MSIVLTTGRRTGARRRAGREALCRCGHPRSRHQMWLAVCGTRVRFVAGGGTCACGACPCERFRPAFGGYSRLRLRSER